MGDFGEGEFYDPDKGTAGFNMALATLERIHVILKNCYIYSSIKEPELWHLSLLALYREVITLIKPEEEKKYSKLLDDANKQKKKLSAEIFRVKNNPKNRGSIVMTAEIYGGLQDLEITLRKIAHIKGLLMLDKEDNKNIFN